MKEFVSFSGASARRTTVLAGWRKYQSMIPAPSHRRGKSASSPSPGRQKLRRSTCRRYASFAPKNKNPGSGRRPGFLFPGRPKSLPERIRKAYIMLIKARSANGRRNSAGNSHASVCNMFRVSFINLSICSRSRPDFSGRAIVLLNYGASKQMQAAPAIVFFYQRD